MIIDSHVCSLKWRYPPLNRGNTRVSLFFFLFLTELQTTLSYSLFLSRHHRSTPMRLVRFWSTQQSSETRGFSGAEGEGEHRVPAASGDRGRKRLQPRKVPIQSNDVPFNLYAKRSIEHIVILIDRIHSVQYWGHWQFDYTRSLPISGLESNPSKIYPRHPLPSYLSISLSLQ